MSHAEQTAYFALIRAGRAVATPAVLADALSITASRAARLLFQLKVKGAARQIGKGKYAILPPETLTGSRQAVQDSFVVAAQLAALWKQEYAVAYASAAYLHGLLDQIPQVAQVAVTSRRQPVKLSETQLIRFVTVLPSRFFGITQLRYGGTALNLTDLEKTVVDCLDRLDLAGGLDQAAQVLKASAEKVEPRKLLTYARRLKNNTLLQRLGYILDKTRLLPAVGNALLPLKHPVPSLLDPRAPRRGRLHPKWQLIENVCLDLES